MFYKRKKQIQRKREFGIFGERISATLLIFAYNSIYKSTKTRNGGNL